MSTATLSFHMMPCAPSLWGFGSSASLHHSHKGPPCTRTQLPIPGASWYNCTQPLSRLSTHHRLKKKKIKAEREGFCSCVTGKCLRHIPGLPTGRSGVRKAVKQFPFPLPAEPQLFCRLQCIPATLQPSKEFPVLAFPFQVTSDMLRRGVTNLGTCRSDSGSA